MIFLFAAQENTSLVVEVRLRPPYAQWRYRLDVIVDQRYVYFDTFSRHVQNFKGVTVYTPTSVLNQSSVVIMFQSGAGVEVVENNRHMTARVYLPISFMVSRVYLFKNKKHFSQTFITDRIKQEVSLVIGRRKSMTTLCFRTELLVPLSTSTICKQFTTTLA